MKQSIVDKPKKKRGRPYQGGRDPMSGVRMPLEEKRAIEAWGAEQSPPLTFSKAVRQLALRGLTTAAAKPASASKPAAGAKAASCEKARQRRRV